MRNLATKELHIILQFKKKSIEKMRRGREKEIESEMYHPISGDCF
jgi:hypothetical protein